MELYDRIKDAMNSEASISELKSILVFYKDDGGSKEEAHLQLYELLQEASTRNEDIILRELIDFTIGYSGKISPIWD